MARQYSKRKKKMGLRIYGFEEFIEAIQKLENVDVDNAAKQCFDTCADIVVQSLDRYMQMQKVPDSLKSKTKTFRVYRHNVYMFAYGWNRDDDAYMKVAWLNYGTPHRYTNSGRDTGRIEAREFIANAKRSAALKMKKAQKDALKRMVEGLQK